MVSTLATERQAAPPIPDAEAVRALLVTYQGLVDVAERVPREASLPRRLVTAGTGRFAIEHVRHALAMLERRYSAHAALADRPALDDEGRERVSQLAASLPPPQSRWRTLALIGGVLVAARAILAVIGNLGAPEGKAMEPLAEAFTRVTDLSLGNLGEAVDVVLDTDLLTTSLVALVFAGAAWVVLRPLMTGAIAFRVLRHGRKPARWYRHERARASELRVDEREAAVFGAIGHPAPPDPRIDLAVKAALAAAVLLVAVAFWRIFLSAEATLSLQVGGDFSPNGGSMTLDDGTSVAWDAPEREPVQAAMAVALGAAAAVRLAWLGLEWRRPFAPRRFALLAVGALAAVFGLLALPDNRRPAAVIVASPLVITDQPERPAVALRYACDEPCFSTGHRLSGFDEEPPRGQRALEVESTALQSPASPLRKALEAADREFGGLDLGFEPPEAVETDEILLSSEQAEWLRSHFADPDTEEVYIEVRIEDYSGNATDMFLGVSPAEP